MSKRVSEDIPSYPSDLGKRISRWRTYQKLTQSELESRAGFGHNALSRIENDQVTPRLESLERIAAAMELSMEELLFRNPPQSDDQLTEDDAVAALRQRLNNLSEQKRQAVVEAFHKLLDQIEK